MEPTASFFYADQNQARAVMLELHQRGCHVIRQGRRVTWWAS